jgi:acyl-CoA synthetase (AMP-forming)/AMP-acid ligase II
MVTPAYDWIAHHAATRGDYVATDDLATGRRFTYLEFDQRIGRLAAGLRQRFGVARGDRVAVLAHNSSDLFEISVRMCEAGGCVRTDELAAYGPRTAVHCRRLRTDRDVL